MEYKRIGKYKANNIKFTWNKILYRVCANWNRNLENAKCECFVENVCKKIKEIISDGGRKRTVVNGLQNETEKVKLTFEVSAIKMFSMLSSN